MSDVNPIFKVLRAIGHHVTRWHILVGGWIALLAYCYPGYMSYDSGVQLEQARGLQPMTNWHPPIMALLWRLCDAIIAGPFLMLAIQTVTLLAGMYLLLRRVLSDRAAALAAVLILLSPPVLAPMAVIWKDSQMAGFLMLGIALMANQTRACLLAGCALVWLGTAQRHNAAAATLPIVVLLFVWKEGLPRWKRYGIATAVWLVITIAAGAANSLLTEKTEDVFSSLAMNDIVGVIRFHPDYTDEQIREDAPGLPWAGDENIAQRSRDLYRADMTWLDVAGDQGVFRYPTTEAETAAVARAWRHLILKHPIGYLENRASVFLAELRVTFRDTFYIWWGFTDGPERSQRLALYGTHTPLRKAWFHMMVWLGNTPVYWAWVYFLAGIVLVWLCRRDVVALTIALSGVACEGGLFIAAPAIDYRYSHWTVTCTILAAVYYIAARRKARRPA